MCIYDTQPLGYPAVMGSLKIYNITSISEVCFFILFQRLHSKHETLAQRWFTVGPPSTMLAQQ